MAISIKNEVGTILINESVIAQIAGSASSKCTGIANAGTTLWGKENAGKGIKVISENDKITIDISIMIDYGVKIAQVAESIMNAVRKQVKEFTGFDVDRVNVLVEGIKVEK